MEAAAEFAVIACPWKTRQFRFVFSELIKTYSGATFCGSCANQSCDENESCCQVHCEFHFYIQELVKIVQMTDEYFIKVQCFYSENVFTKNFAEKIKSDVSTAVTCFIALILITPHFPPIKATIDEAVNFAGFWLNCICRLASVQPQIIHDSPSKLIASIVTCWQNIVTH